MRTLLAALLLALSLGPAFAVEPEEMLDDPVLEERAREISKELRCLVCQNQSIDESNAGLARDLRVLVRERLTAGDSNEAAMRYIVDRYGDFVLLRPPIRPGTYALWFGPALLFAVAGLGLFVFFRRRQRVPTGAAPPPLTEDERARLEKLMDEDPKQ
jgi:cytochrome c-type biogenesis protein CcmH